MKIISKGRPYTDIYVFRTICPACGAEFEFSSDEYISSYDWSGVNCPCCKHAINYDKFKNSKTHRRYWTKYKGERIKWEDNTNYDEIED